MTPLSDLKLGDSFIYCGEQYEIIKIIYGSLIIDYVYCINKDKTLAVFVVFNDDILVEKVSEE